VEDECGVCGGSGPTEYCLMSPMPVCDIRECDDHGGAEGGGGGGGGGGLHHL